jgi:hypothetical protein
MRITSFVAGVLVAGALQPASQPKNLGEITVERINVVDRDGTLRMVISNKDRMHPGVVDGKTFDRSRPVAGMIFFNDDGDEVGGLTYTGHAASHAAVTTMNFDQLRQDQTVGLVYEERENVRNAGLQVWDRSDWSLGELVQRLTDAKQIRDERERDAATAKALADFPPGPRRLFAGKQNKAATVSLADGNGKPRLTMTVDANGNPRIEILDDTGKVTNRWPAQ